MKHISRIPLKNCKGGYLYELHSRNLSYGVFDGRDGFIGPRLKFGSRYLFTELHFDIGAPYGTASPTVETEFAIKNFKKCKEDDEDLYLKKIWKLIQKYERSKK